MTNGKVKPKTENIKRVHLRNPWKTQDISYGPEKFRHGGNLTEGQTFKQVKTFRNNFKAVGISLHLNFCL